MSTRVDNMDNGLVGRGFYKFQIIFYDGMNKNIYNILKMMGNRF